MCVEVAGLTVYQISVWGHRENANLLRSSELKDFAFSAHSTLTLLRGHVGLTVSPLDGNRNRQKQTRTSHFPSINNCRENSTISDCCTQSLLASVCELEVKKTECSFSTWAGMVSCCTSPVECLLAYSVDTLCNFKYDYRAVHDCHVAVDNESRELQEGWCQWRAWAADGGGKKLVCFNKLSF